MELLVEMGDAEYRLVVDGNEGGVVPFGLPAICKAGEDVYYTHVTDPDGTDKTPQVYRVDSVTEVTGVTTEEVDFEDDEPEPGEEEEEPETDPDVEEEEEEEEDDDDDDDDGAQIVDVDSQRVEDR